MCCSAACQSLPPCAGAAVADAAESGGGRQAMAQAAANGNSSFATHTYDSDSPESAGASADESSSGEAGADIRADELSDSTESAGLSGDDEALDDRHAQAGPRRGQSGAGAPAGQVRAERKWKRPVTSVEADDETAFSDGEEAPLMSPEGVAAATAGLEEPSSEDDDDDDDEQGGGGDGAGRHGARGGMLAEAGDSDDSDAEDDGAPLRNRHTAAGWFSCSRTPSLHAELAEWCSGQT